MKIALCLEYPLAHRGGVSVLVETLLLEISRLGHDVVLASPDAPEDLPETVRSARLRQHFHWDPRQPSRARSRILARQLADAGVDLAHFHSGGNYGWGNRLPFRSPPF